MNRHFVLIAIAFHLMFIGQIVAQRAAFPIDPYSECTFLNESTGSFNSPNYPRAYPENLQICWLISTDPDTRAEVTIPMLNTEQNVDVLTIYDGPTTSYFILRTLSGQLYPGQIPANTNNMLMVFTTNGYATGDPGFTGDYRSII